MKAPEVFWKKRIKVTGRQLSKIEGTPQEADCAASKSKRPQITEQERRAKIRNHKSWFILWLIGTLVASSPLYLLLDFFRNTGHGSIIHILAAFVIIVFQVCGGALILTGVIWRTLAIGPLRGILGVIASLCFVPVDPTGNNLMFYLLPGLFAPFLIFIALPKPLTATHGGQVRDVAFFLLVMASIVYFILRIFWDVPAFT